MRKPSKRPLIASLAMAAFATAFLVLPVFNSTYGASLLAEDVLMPSVAGARAKVEEDLKASPLATANLHAALSNAQVQLREEATVLQGEESNGHLETAIDEAEDLLETPFLSATEVEEMRESLEEATAQSMAATSRAQLNTYFEEENLDGTVTAYAMYLGDGEPIYGHDAARQFTPASTYKLFVAYSMLKAVEEGDAHWDTPLAGQTLSTCFDIMIIESDNVCPEAWLERVGMDEMTLRAEELGVKNTVFEWSNFLTTAEDLSIAMRSLLTGDVIEDRSLDRLKSVLEDQLYREGVAAAFPDDVVVGGKVGFLRGYLHDVSFVESDKGDIVVTVLTENKQWSAIADAAERIYDSMPAAQPPVSETHVGSAPAAE